MNIYNYERVKISSYLQSALSFYFQLLLAGFIAILAGIQIFGASRDVFQYELFFQNLDLGYDGRFEPLFVYLSFAIKTLFDDFGFFIFFLTFVSISIKIKLLFNNNYAFFLLLIYFLVLFILHELTQYRISIALAFAYYGLHLKSKNYRLMAYLFLCIAFFMHYSTGIFFPALIFWDRLKKLPLVVIIFLSIFIFVSKEYIFNFTININPTLMESEFTEPVNFLSSRNIIFLLVAIIGLFYQNKLPDDKRSWLAISLYGLGLWLIFNDIPVFAHRLLEETIFSYFMWITTLPRLPRKITFILFFVLGVYLFYRSLFIDPLLV